MKTIRITILVSLSLFLAWGITPGVVAAELPRLFPDLTLRYPVGDSNATNPVRSTEGPKSLVAADMNGDGLADVIAGNLDGSISVLLGQTNKTLANQILVPATGLLSNCSLRAIVAADFNGDGRMDVAAGDIAGESVLVLLGNGDGTLLPYARIPLGPARAMAAADFNHDGFTDMLVACSPADCEWCYGMVETNAHKRFLCILDGRGDGTFASPRYLLTPGATACFYDVAAADMNGDGQPEAMSLDFSYCPSRDGTYVYRMRRLQIFANDGNGGFATNTPVRVLEMEGEGPRAFQLAYLDEKLERGLPPLGGSLDIIVVNRDSSTLDVFLNKGGFEFTPPVSFHAGDSPRDIGVGDLDGDGYADLVLVNRNANSISVMRGLGNGLFASSQLEYPTGVSPRQIALADINGDGVLDAAVNNRETGDISLFIGERGLAGFLVPGGWYPAGISPVSVVAVDFNHDGYPDVATANLRSHDVRVRLNNRNGTLSNEVIYPVNYEPAVLASGDLNGDGHIDLVVSCLGSKPDDYHQGTSGSLLTLLGLGDGTFTNGSTMLMASNNVTGNCQPYWLRLGDLDGDGELDAAVGGVHGELIVFRGNGDGSFESGQPVGFYPLGRPLGLALGDFDRDGQLDIATSRGNIFFNNSHFFDGLNYEGAWNWIAPTGAFVSGTQAWATETADLDMDGNLDLMVALTFQRPDPIGVLYGDEHGQFAQPDLYEGPDVGAVAIVAQDMDGDQITDLVVGNRCAASVMILNGLGDRDFGYREVINAYAVEHVAVADMNQDGKPDIIGVGSGLWVLLNGSRTEFNAPNEVNTPGVPTRSGLFINEIMALNQGFIVTNNTTPDWVEIYNHSAVAQPVAGWQLAQFTEDGGTNVWTFPGTNDLAIPPYGHLVVYCKHNPGLVTGLYATFELSSDGENLALLNPSGTVIDSVTFPAMPADVSYGRSFDGARFFAYNPSPTLGTANQRPANLKPTAVRKDPYIGCGASTLGLNARVFDDVAVAYSAICYRLQGQSAFQELPLSDDGLNGDKEAGDGYFGAILPSLTPGATVEYYIRVIDIEGQVGTMPDNPETSLYRVIVPSPNPALRISEIVAENRTGILDEHSQHEDWLELFNSGSTPINLGGLVLTKDFFNKDGAWPLPNQVLPAGGRVVVFCDDDSKQGPFHATFKLLRSSDRVFLIRQSDWVIIDSVSFGWLPADTSFGILNTETTPQLLAWPTPGQSNLPIPANAKTGAQLSTYGKMLVGVGGTNAFELRWFGSSNTTYRAYFSQDLSTWIEGATSPVCLGQGLFQWRDLEPLGQIRFYRIQPIP